MLCNAPSRARRLRLHEIRARSASLNVMARGQFPASDGSPLDGCRLWSHSFISRLPTSKGPSSGLHCRHSPWSMSPGSSSYNGVRTPSWIRYSLSDSVYGLMRLGVVLLFVFRLIRLSFTLSLMGTGFLDQSEILLMGLLKLAIRSSCSMYSSNMRWSPMAVRMETYLAKLWYCSTSF